MSLQKDSGHLPGTQTLPKAPGPHPPPVSPPGLRAAGWRVALASQNQCELKAQKRLHVDFSSRPTTRERPRMTTSHFSNKLRLEARPLRPGARNWKPATSGVTHVLCHRRPGTTGLDLLSKKARFGSFSGEFLFCNHLKGSLPWLKNFKGSIKRKFSERRPERV